MKIIVAIIRLLLLPIILVCSSALSLASPPQQNILLVTEQWPPFNYQEDGQLKGFSVELVQQMMAVMNSNYPIDILPSMRSTRVLASRPNTLMFSLFRTPDREDKYKWIGPLVETEVYFYKRKDSNIKTDTLEDLKRLDRVGTRHAGIIVQRLRKLGFNNLDSTATSSMQIYKMRSIGRFDVAISDSDLGVMYNLDKLNIDRSTLEKIPLLIFKSELYLAANKSLPDDEVQRWQAALDRLKSNGDHQKLLDKYLNP